ncbi:LysE/ArgO family amino acid transporter [Kingella negevensis]|uniref:LysE/ArgO family amino acid transporter n=1 Tax=Kingella negevensis TaxID=1522312 RepID=UPI00050A0AC6|nr:LysE/ArgO family amino acid transporter [Kingella negevensis]MDK4689355.1 LysE/ArgO family amino acid transporter [Kingella negevensis]WII90502.1 LysE/ArgO family amino acid transporter [Kingella negevensis]
MLSTIIKGFAVSGGLIMAIGAQNAYVLKQGLLRQHIFFVALTCFLCDFVLISAGILGMGNLLSQSPVLSALLSLGGGLFLFWYGLNSFRSALSPNQATLVADAENAPQSSLKKAILGTLAVTLLNPHVYIDTIMLVGGIAATLTFADKIWFLIGALSASFIWFFGLSYGARLLRPIFANPRAWKVLETLIGIGMWWLAFGLFKYFYDWVVA